MSRTDRTPRTRLDPDSRRAGILEAAARAFAARPYADVTLAAIAADAEASPALIYRYFESKEVLYATIVRLAIDDLIAKQESVLDELPEGIPTRERVKAVTLVYLDHIASHPDAWAMPLLHPGIEPAAVGAMGTEARRDHVERLAALLEQRADVRHAYALWGYYGYLDAACLRWIQEGCPDDHRWSLVESALGALEGALGDWSV